MPEKTPATQLTPNEQSVFIDAMLCAPGGLESVKVDYERLATLRGLKNRASAAAIWCPLRKKILAIAAQHAGAGAGAGAGGEKGEGEGAGAGSAPVTPRKQGGHRGAGRTPRTPRNGVKRKAGEEDGGDGTDTGDGNGNGTTEDGDGKGIKGETRGSVSPVKKVDVGAKGNVNVKGEE